MDLNDWRIAATLASLVMFLGVAAWALSARRRAAFDEAAQLPFTEELPASAVAGDKQ